MFPYLKFQMKKQDMHLFRMSLSRLWKRITYQAFNLNWFGIANNKYEVGKNMLKKVFITQIYKYSMVK